MDSDEEFNRFDVDKLMIACMTTSLAMIVTLIQVTVMMRMLKMFAADMK